MTEYAPNLVVVLGVTALKQLQVSVVGSLGMLRSYGKHWAYLRCLFIISQRVTSRHPLNRFRTDAPSSQVLHCNKKVKKLESSQTARLSNSPKSAISMYKPDTN